MYTIKLALSILIKIIDSLVMVRVLLSFFPNMQSSNVSYFIYQMTEPILAPCRAILDRVGLNMGMIDFSPILAFLILNIIENLVYAI